MTDIVCENCPNNEAGKSERKTRMVKHVIYGHCIDYDVTL